MPTFVFIDPTGKRHSVIGPEGATRAQAWAALQKSFREREAEITQDPIYKQRQSLAKELAQSYGPVGAGTVAAGRAFAELGRGIGIGGLLGVGTEEAPSVQRSYHALQVEHPVPTIVGESAPYLSAGGVAGAISRSLPVAVAAQAAAGGMVGGLMPGNPYERANRALMEGLAGASGELGGRLLAKTGGLGIRPAGMETQKVVRDARELGFLALPSSTADSKYLRQVLEGGLESTPGGAVVFDEIAARNADRLAKLTSEAIGLEKPVTELNGEIIDKAFANLGKKFDRLMPGTLKVPVTDDLLKRIISIDEERVAPMIVGPTDPVKGAVDKTLQFFEKHYEQGIPAAEIQAQSSKLGKVAKRAMSSNPELGFALYDIQDAILDAARRKMSKNAALQLDKARGQYRALKLLTDRNNFDPVTGEVKAGNLANTMQKKDFMGFGRSRNQSDWYKAIRFLARVQPPLKSSGTAERSQLQRMMQTATTPATAGAGGLGYLLGGPAGALLAPTVGANLVTRMYTGPAAANLLTRSVGNPAFQAFRGVGLLGGYTAAQGAQQ